MFRTLLPLAAVAPLLALMPGSHAQEGDKNLDSVQAYLMKEYARKKWQTGPKPLTSDEIERAYGANPKFYFVFSAPPLPPGANLPQVIKEYEARLKDYQDNFVSATLRVSAEGKVNPLSKAGDFNEGLMAVASEYDVKTATAAVLALYGSGKVAPGDVKAVEVKLTETDKGWKGLVNRPNQFQGAVEFNDKGQVIGMNKFYTGPLPP